MASGIVYEGVTRQPDPDEHGEQQTKSGLFSGLKLWFSHGVPQRTWFIEQAKANGAEIVPLEKQADVKLVDHTRRHNAPGTHSYQFIEASLRQGVLEDLAKHRAGATFSVDRPVGSIVTGPKGTRTKFTDEEDQYLWNVITPFKERGGQWKGNVIYQQIAVARPSHTYQSWRDRYLKHVIHQNRTVTSNVSIEADVADREEDTNTAIEAPKTNAVQRPSATPAATRKRPRIEEQAIREVGEQSVTQQQVTSRSPRRPSPGKRARLLDGIEESARAAEAELQWTPAASSRTPRMEGDAQPAGQGVVDHGIPRDDRRSPLARNETSASAKNKPFPDEYPEEYPRNFTAEIYRMLFEATPTIKLVDAETLAAAFDQVAESHSDVGHPGQDWRLFWQEVVWPRYRKQFNEAPLPLEAKIPRKWSVRPPPKPPSKPLRSQKQEPKAASRSDEAEQQCSQCMTTETTKWRHDKQGNTYCNQCGRFMKDARLRSISGAFTEVPDEPSPAEEEQNNESKPVEAEQEEPELPSATPHLTVMKPSATPVSARQFGGYSDAGVQTSPILSPQPLNGTNITDEPLQRRDTSRAPEPNEARKRSASRTSQSHSQESDKLLTEVTDGPESVEIAPQLSRNSPIPDPRKRAPPSKVLEIPSTPEHGTSPDQEADLDDRSIAAQPRASTRSDSPLFIPEGEVGEKAPASPTGRLVSSPLRVRLLDSSPTKDVSSQREAREQSPQSEADYDFGTGPDLSQEWETAPESPSGYKRQPHEPSSSSSDEADYTLGLPEPDGGWSELGIPDPMPGEFEEDVPDAEDEIEYVGTEATGGNNIDGWYEVIDLTLDDEDVEPSESASQRGIRLNQALRPASHGKSVASPLPQRSKNAPAAARAAAAADPADTDIDVWWRQEQKRFEFTNVRAYVLDRILSAAIDATSFDYKLASTIIRPMITKSKTHHGREMRQQGRWTALVPADVKGVWTEGDDMALNDESGYDEARRVMKKHGASGCEDRREFLRLQNAV